MPVAAPRSAIFSVIGDSPRCKPRDYTTARTFYLKILDAIERGGWTSTERAKLHKLKKLWHPRAYGLSRVFNEQGTRPGRPISTIQRDADDSVDAPRIHRRPSSSSGATAPNHRASRLAASSLRTPARDPARS